VAAQLRVLLSAHEVRLRSSSVQVVVVDSPDPRDDLALTVFDDMLEGETGRVVVPATVAGLNVEQRWWLAFTVLCRTCEELATVAGEDAAPWPLLAEELLSRGPAERLASAWKASPDRRHRARLVTDIRVDQPSETWIEVARRGQDEPIGRSRTVRAAIGRRGPDAPTWRDAGAVAIDLLVDDGRFLLNPTDLVAELTDLEPVEPLAATALAGPPQVPAVRVTHFSTRDPERPADVQLGEINGKPGLLPRDHRRAWRAAGRARLPQLKHWWATSGLARLHISAVCMPEAAKTSSWLDGRDLWVEVPLHPRSVAHLEPEQAVLEALGAAVAIASGRAKIEPPDLT
jgi:hypothetical protein